MAERPNPISRDTCAKCGEVHAAGCVAHKKSTGKPCGNPPLRGATVCRSHGAGRNTRARAKARRTLVEGKALASIASQPVVPIDNPIEALAEMAAEARAFKDFAAGQVAELASLDVTTKDGGEQTKAVVQVYERAFDRAGRFLEACVKLGLDARRVELDEAQGALLEAALTRALGAVALPEGAEGLILEALAVELRGS